MKIRQKSIRTSTHALLAIAFLVIGLNHASAQIETPSASEISPLSISGTTSLVPGDWSGTGD